MKHFVHCKKSFFTVKWDSCNAERLKSTNNVSFNSCKLLTSLIDILFRYGKGYVIHTDKAVIAFCKLFTKHIAVFFADIIELIVTFRKFDYFLKIIIVCYVHNGNLKFHTAVKAIQQTAVFSENVLLL